MSKRVYNEVLAEQVIERILCGEKLVDIARALGIEPRTLAYWESDNRFGFGDRMRDARKSRCHYLRDEILDIADNCPPTDLAIKRANMQIKARQWLHDRIEGRDRPAPKDEGDAAAEIEAGSVASPAEFLRQWQARNPPKATETN